MDINDWVDIAFLLLPLFEESSEKSPIRLPWNFSLPDSSHVHKITISLRPELALNPI